MTILFPSNLIFPIWQHTVILKCDTLLFRLLNYHPVWCPRQC